MNRQEKAQVIDLLHDGFSNNQAAFLVNFKGLSVKQMQLLRKSLRQHGGFLKVAKARLMRRATEGIEGVDGLKDFLKEQVGLIFVEHNSPAVAKALHEFSKQNEALKVVAGFLDHQVLDKTSVIRIAQLPSRQQLLAQLCGTLNAPLTSFVGILHTMVVRPLVVLKQIADKKTD